MDEYQDLNKDGVYEEWNGERESEWRCGWEYG